MWTLFLVGINNETMSIVEKPFSYAFKTNLIYIYIYIHIDYGNSDH